jgi:hypothetical protein
MILPGTFAIMVNRWQPASYTFDFPGYDFSGAAAHLEVRKYRDQDGAALISLDIGSGIEIVVNTVEGTTTSSVTTTFSESAIEALPFPSPRGPDLPLVYDLVIEGGGLGKVRWFEGPFTAHSGATQV